ncbi:mRNA capping enzyme, large subunit family protein [Histomonas meleagridis]|uniref:mRNA capping enzyme, large subunit family protein n=1 Tax=Histomonas meleagridis TaxID=135588 RepID=UPI00355AA6AE|nr:mRNA capping enzyme, large subunit family protein [Histomonas meleagridis]KAH0802042.1 mRNA capping enzyme, large subunit family protein [Histomonas meleagridis]
MKSVLIDQYCPKYASIFDCACGKGGDIPKWKRKDPNEFVFGDISFDSLKRAYEKYKKVERSCNALFYSGDIFSCRMTDILPQDIRFHISSCQFAFHYAFRDETTARSAISNLCDRLHPGGYVLLTIPNACRIVKLLRQYPDQRQIGNSLYYIERHFDLDDIPIFGAEYVFNLVESVDNCAEYLVHPQVMASLFHEQKCELIETMPFQDYYHVCMTSFPHMKKLFSELLMRLGMENAEMTEEEWQVISLYSYYVFRKSGNLPPTHARSKMKEQKSDTFQIQNVETGEIVTVNINN